MELFELVGNVKEGLGEMCNRYFVVELSVKQYPVPGHIVEAYEVPCTV